MPAKQTNKNKRGAPLLGLAKSIYYDTVSTNCKETDRESKPQNKQNLQQQHKDRYQKINSDVLVKGSVNRGNAQLYSPGQTESQVIASLEIRTCVNLRLKRLLGELNRGREAKLLGLLGNTCFLSVLSVLQDSK